MTIEEATRRIKARFDKWALDDEDTKAIKTLIPELCENEDEKIREFLIGILSSGTWRKEWPFSPNEVVAYLERQNHVQSDTEKEYVRTLKSLIFNFLRGKDEVDRDYYQRIEDWLDERHIEQKEQEYTNVLEDAFKYYTDRGITISCGDFKAEPKKEQKQAEWSDEDERILKGIIGLIDHDQHYGVSNNEMISWLKSLRPQQKVEWSEKDKKMLWIIQLALTKHPITDKQEKDAFDWLNSLRPQPQAKTNDYITPHKKFFKWIYNRLIDVHNENPNVDYMRSFKERIDNLQFDEPHWKPSEEQMEALKCAIDDIAKFSKIGGRLVEFENRHYYMALHSLYEHLRTLM